jgi:hypothetical protein
MAEFGIQATELSAPQGAGSSPVAPARQQFVETSIMPVLTDIGNIFARGLSDTRKQDAENKKNLVVGEYVGAQERINQAVATGQMRPDVAATRSRALFGQYSAGYAPYIEDLHKARNALSGGSELGAIEDSVKQAAAVQNARVSNAQSRGATIYNWMDADTLEKTLHSSEVAKRHEMEIDRQIKINAENRSASAEQRTIYDRELKVKANSMITEIAGSNIDRMTSFISNLSSKMNEGMPPEEANAVLTKEFAQVEGAIQAAAGLNPEMAGPYRSLFNDMKMLGAKVLDPKTRSEADKNAYDVIINKAKLLAITSDPKMKAVVVANELLGGNAVTALNSTVPISDFIAKMSKSELGDNQFVPQVVGNPEAEKDVLSFLNNSLKKFNDKGFGNQDKAGKEMTNSINHVLSQTGDLMKTGKLDATKVGNLATFFASPEYGKFASSGKLNPEAAEAAKQAWQVGYVPAVEQSIGGRIAKIEESFPGGGGVPKRKIDALVDIRFSGSGITFDLKDTSAMEPYEKVQQKKAVDDLNAVKAGINQLIHIGAHMEGHTDYARYWEENKYLYVPQIYPARAGVIVNGYKSKGGVGSDPKNWEKVSE